MCAERAWAHAMEIKSSVSGEVSGKTRSYMRRRFHKAAAHATELDQIASVMGDLRTALEAEAYASWMKGLAHLEKGKEWALALESFTKARY